MSTKEMMSLSEKTVVPLKWAIWAIGVAIAAVIAATTSVGMIRSDIADCKAQVIQMQKSLISREELITWRDEMADSNPAIKVPRVMRKN